MVELYNDDCLVAMHRLINNGIKVDAIITDIPYGSTVCKWDTVIPFGKMWQCLEKLIKPKGNIVLFASGMFTHKLALSNEKLFRYELIWKKSKCGSPLTAKYMPLKKHENILVFGRSAAYYQPQMMEGKPYKRKYTLNKTNNLGYGIAGVATDNKGTRHPTQKPIELMEFLVKSYCPEDGTVLDFTMGSGSTGVACKKANRHFIGIELDKNYFNIAKERIEEYDKE